MQKGEKDWRFEGEFRLLVSIVPVQLYNWMVSEHIQN